MTPLFSIDPAIATRVEAEAGKALKAWASRHGQRKGYPESPQPIPTRAERRGQIARVLRLRGRTTLLDLMKATNMCRSQVHDNCRAMMRDGEVKAIRTGLAVAYQLTGDA